MELLPLVDFKHCQLCGFHSDDICEFRIWQKCDTQDQPIDDFLVACTQPACFQRIDADSILFRELPWGGGKPGVFVFVCGDCPHRNNFTCTNPNLKANGGSGLEVRYASPVVNAMVCSERGGCRPAFATAQAVACIGNPKV